MTRWKNWQSYVEWCEQEVPRSLISEPMDYEVDFVVKEREPKLRLVVNNDRLKGEEREG